MVKKILYTVFLVLFLINTCGCVALLAGAAGGAGTATWLAGKLAQETNTSFDKSLQASKSALEALKLEITKETRKRDVAQVKGKYTDGRVIWIDIHKISPSITRIEVRVGIRGDQEAARKILDKILKYL